MTTSEEEALVNSFVVAVKRERMLAFLANPKRRAEATATLAHFKDLDQRHIVTLPSDQQSNRSIERALRARGAGDSCLVISENRVLDGKRLLLAAALDQVIGQGMGTLLSCVPGKLAFYEGEGPTDRCILERRAT